MQQKSVNEAFVNWGLLALVGLTRGSAFILMKKGVQVFSATEVAGLRIFSAALFLLPWSLPRLKQLTLSHYQRLFLISLTGTLLPASLMAQAQTQLDSALIGVLSSLAPIFTLLVSSIWFLQPITRNELRGALLGLIGTLMLIFIGTEHGIGKINYYALLPLLACFFHGLNANLVRHYLQDLNAYAIVSVSLLLVGIISAVTLLTQTGFLHKMQTIEGAYVAAGYVLLLGFLGTVITQLFFINLIKRTSPVFASMVAFIMPIVAMGWGLLDGEVLVWGQYLGIATILGGVYFVNKRSKVGG